jgi:hypothetical protein
MTLGRVVLVPRAALGAYPHYPLLPLLLALLQGEGAAGWHSDHLIVAEALVNSLAEKFSAPLQVGGGHGGRGRSRNSHSMVSQQMPLVDSVQPFC